MKRYIHSLFLLPVMILAVACGTEQTADEACSDLPQGKIRQDCIDKMAPKADRWDSQNDPRLFGIDLEYKFEDLPLSGQAERIPWPDTYWPTNEDSVNARWQGPDVLSPVEKYDRAFNDWEPPEGFMNLVPFSNCGDEFDSEYYAKLGPAAKYWSEHKGNKTQRDTWDDKDVCKDKIESWWGLCHAWVPASILEPEPAKSVTYNGVTFDVSDMKALMIMMYDRSQTKFLGRRCNTKNEEIERDEFGRIKQTECRDTNAGSMYLIVTNMLGRDKRAFAEDRTMDYQVWNQPVMGYEVKQHQEIDEEQATKLIDPDCDADGGTCEYTWNEDAKRFFEVLMDVKYITESYPSKEPRLPIIDNFIRTDTYHMVLEADADGKIIGGEWLSEHVTAFPDRLYTPDSQATHADFLWLPIRVGYRSNPYADLEKIRMLVKMSLEDEEPGNIDAKTYVNEDSVAIPDNDKTGVSSLVTVDDDIDIDTLKVAVEIKHTYVGDLTLTLVHDGHEVVLQKNAGGSTADIKKTFSVADFAGSAKGEWELHVVDNAARDTGTIERFELIVIAGDGSSPANSEVFSSNTSIDIPDNDEQGTSSTIDVAGDGAVKSLLVTVDISHTWVSDLVIELHHGTGVATLHNREGDDSHDIKRTFTVDDFEGMTSEGDWTLVVKDLAKRDTGTINSWSMEMKRDQ